MSGKERDVKMDPSCPGTVYNSGGNGRSTPAAAPPLRQDVWLYTVISRKKMWTYLLIPSTRRSAIQFWTGSWIFTLIWWLRCVLLAKKQEGWSKFAHLSLRVLTSDSKFCHRWGIAQSEGRGQGQCNKLCLAVAMSSWIPPFKSSD